MKKIKLFDFNLEMKISFKKIFNTDFLKIKMNLSYNKRGCLFKTASFCK